MPPRPYLTARVGAVLALAAMPLVAMPAFGQGTEEQQQACTPDAVKLCSDTIPDIPKTTACMKAHFSQLSPRCQSAFSDAVGGDKTKTAAKKAEPRARTATRAERRMPERAAAPKPQREAREPLPEREDRQPLPERDERAAALPPRGDTDPTLPPQVEGYPPFPSPQAPLVRAPSTTRSQIAQACRAGLIDSFTCSTTVPALLGGSAN